MKGDSLICHKFKGAFFACRDAIGRLLRADRRCRRNRRFLPLLEMLETRDLPTAVTMYPGTVTDDSSVGTIGWSFPSNVSADDSSYSDAAGTPIVSTSHYLKPTNFGYSFSSGTTINGILVEIKELEVGNVGNVTDNRVSIVKNGTIGSANYATTSAWSTTEGWVSYGGATDLWGTTWSVSDINATNFGTVLRVNLPAGSPFPPFSTESARVNAVRITVYATVPHHEPVGGNNTVTTLEDTPCTFTTGDWNFSDPNDSPADSFQAVKITTLPGSGTLKNGTTNVAAGDFINVSDISAGNLKFYPAANAHNAPYTSFTFQVQDSGGAGVDLDSTANTMTVNVTSVNDPPSGADKTITILEDNSYTFATSDWGFSDPSDSPPNNFYKVKITGLPSNGTLKDNGVAVALNQFLDPSDTITFYPAANGNGNPYTSFTFQVQDDGGVLNGGVDLDPSPNTITVNVTSVNDEPAGTDGTVTGLEDQAYVFATSDFGFTDPNDSPPNNFSGVLIASLPAAGTLYLTSPPSPPTPITASGTFINASDISAGNFQFVPAANAHDSPYTTFTFQVKDDGGTLNGGSNLDSSANTLTINVTSVNDAPSGANNTVTGTEDQYYTFTAANFGFTDPNDSPPNNFLAVKVTTTPALGNLYLTNTWPPTPVTAGQFVAVSDITAGHFKFAPASNASGSPYTSFTFQVQDDGGTSNGGIDLDPTPKTMTINVTPVADDITASGTVLVGLEQRDLTNVVVASFVDASPNAYVATILWGDGQSSPGVIAANGSGFGVTGSHHYERRGPYPVVVQIQDTTDGEIATAASYASILALDDHTRVQSVTVENLTPLGGAIVETSTGTPGTYAIASTTGTYSYKLVLGYSDGLYSTVTSTLSATNLNFTLDAKGYTLPFTLGSFNLTENGSATLHRDITTFDLGGKSTGSEDGTLDTVTLTKTGTLASYSLNTTRKVKLTSWSEDGTYAGNTYHLAQAAGTTTTTTIGLAETGNYLAGTYTEVRNENTPTTAWLETGKDYSDNYSQNGSSAGSVSFTENGDLLARNYTVTSTNGSTSGSSSDTSTNGVASGSFNAGGDPVTSTLTKTASWLTGYYTLHQTITANNGTGSVSFTDQTASGSESGTGSETDILDLSGYYLDPSNVLTGDYTLDEVTTGSGNSSGSGSNLTASGGGTSSGTGTSTLHQTGNVLSANYDLTITTTGSGGGSDSGNNQTASGSGNGSASGTSSLHRFGNAQTGGYTLHDQTTTGGSDSGTASDNGASAGGSSTLNPTLTITDGTGNTLSGVYDTTSTTTGGGTDSGSSSNQTASSSTTAPSISTFISSTHDFGNRNAGTWTIHTISGSSTSTSTTASNLSNNVTTTATTTTSSTVDASGNRVSGAYSSSDTGTTTTTTTSETGTDPRGTFTVSSASVTVTTNSSQNGNSINGSYTLDAAASSTSSSTKTGSDGSTSYTLTVNGSSSSTLHETGNATTGSYNRSSMDSGSTTSDETGNYLGTPFTIHETGSTASWQSSNGNAISGGYVLTAGSHTGSEIHATGNSGGVSYDFHKTSFTDRDWTDIGNSVTGVYNQAGIENNGSSSNEFNTYADGSASFVENLSGTDSFTDTGNNITGIFTGTKTNGTRSSNLTDVTTDASGTYSITQWTSGTFSGSSTGNRVTGNYTSTESAFDIYSTHETGGQVGPTSNSLNLTITGSNAYNTTETGNSVTALYTRTKTGTDSYTMTESGTKSLLPYAETVTGTDNYALVDTGNTATGHYIRDITGGGNYFRIDVGLGATLPSGPGANSYHWTQTGDPHSGVFTLTKGGTSRFDLLEDFKDVSNTQASKTPGHMNVIPFGQTFVDPPPNDWRDVRSGRAAPRGHMSAVPPVDHGEAFGFIEVMVGGKGAFALGRRLLTRGAVAGTGTAVGTGTAGTTTATSTGGAVWADAFARRLASDILSRRATLRALRQLHAEQVALGNATRAAQVSSLIDQVEMEIRELVLMLAGLL